MVMQSFFQKAAQQHHPLRTLEEFLNAEEAHRTAKKYDELRFVGYVLDIGFDTVTLITSDPFKTAVGGVPRNSLLVMVPDDLNRLPLHFSLLRVLETAPTPLKQETAQTFFEQELVLARTTGPLWLRAQALFGLAGVAAANGQALRAARLLGAADARAEAAATYTDAADALYQRHTIDLIAAQIDKATFELVRAEGRRMTFEQAADYVLQEASQ